MQTIDQRIYAVSTFDNLVTATINLWPFNLRYNTCRCSVADHCICLVWCWYLKPFFLLVRGRTHRRK